MFPSAPSTHWLRRSLVVLTLAASTLLAGCVSMYVDTATQEVPASQVVAPAQPLPVRLVFEFQTKGAPNATATQHLKAQVLAQVKASGLFASVAEEGSGAMLQVTLNNVPITEDAAAKGFVTGLTFGLAGSAVTDGYICTLSYLAAGASAPLVKTARHAIHTTLGNAAAPPNAVKSASVDAAVTTMTRQILANALRDLSQDPQFSARP